MKRHLKNCKGMTLVELVIGIAVFAIFSLGAVSILVPVLNTYAHTAEFAELEVLAGTIGEYLVSDIGLAKEILPIEDSAILRIRKTAGGETVYAVNEEGILTVNDVPAFAKEYYKGYKVALEFTQNGNVTAIQIDLTGKTQYSKTVYSKRIG